MDTIHEKQSASHFVRYLRLWYNQHERKNLPQLHAALSWPWNIDDGTPELEGRLGITYRNGRRAERGITIKPTSSNKLRVVTHGQQQTARSEMLRKFLLTMGISAGSFVISVLAHNAISAWFDIEEPVFFAIAVFVCPAAFLVGAVGSIVLAIRRWMAQ